MKKTNMTAVEWLVNQMFVGIADWQKDLIQQANEMFEQQIIDAYDEGYDIGAYGDVCEPEQYFNETYKKDKI